MARAGPANVIVRLSVLNPPPGIAHSLQDKDGAPADARMSDGKTIVFQVPARLEQGKSGWRFLGEYVRTEGKTRRFIYVATGRRAGQHDTACDRRAKVDLPDVTTSMIRKAEAGILHLDGAYEGADARGEPACATVAAIWSPQE